MKLMSVAPLLCSVALVAGSSAWANYSYNVFAAPAAAPAATVLTSPAIVGAGACGFIPHAIDPYAPLWQQAVLDYNNTGLRVNDGLYASTAPLAFGGVAAAPIGLQTGVLNQAAIISGAPLLGAPTVVNSPAANQPLYIEAPNAFDVSLLAGNAPVVQQQSAVIQQAAPQQQQIIKRTTTTTRYVQQRVIKKRHHLLRRCFGR